VAEPDPDGPFRYRVEVVAALARHGIRPTPRTRPELVREFVRDLYLFEIRRLRSRLLKREFPRSEYAGRVDALRRQYPVLALLPHQLTSESDEAC
jgi:hypothetical protein